MNEDELKSPFLERSLFERFKRYAEICTTSEKNSNETPSTAGQWELARLLADELRALGIETELTDHCYVIGRLKDKDSIDLRRKDAQIRIGFLAHLDTSQDVSGKDVKVVLEDGIVRAGGETLLGADDKAGIAAIMTAAEYFVRNPSAPRPPLEIIFTPDEETGKGLPCLPLEKITAKYCYTVDGGPAPEIEVECFNAWHVKAAFTGKAIHPGEARGKLVNAALMAAHFAGLFPRNESPEAADGYYGYYCLTEISGTHEAAHAEFIIRDFERGGMERRLAAVKAFACATEAAFPGGKVELDIKMSYLNMKEKIDAAPQVLEKLRAACRAAGIEPRLKPIRGGTDGARLTELGIPTPNLWTGGRNFHSRSESLSLLELAQTTRALIALAKEWAKAD